MKTNVTRGSLPNPTIAEMLHFPIREKRLPVLFIGHGSPMNAIENNEFTAYWNQLGRSIDTPSAVLVISAHWLTRGTTKVTAMSAPKTIHDFGGFPQALFDVQYPALGSPELALETQQIIKGTAVELDHDWGLDHGTWSVVKHMYPEAHIPVVQLSIDYAKPSAYHYKLAGELMELRRRGVLIIGSGNMVHNLRIMDWNQMNTPNYGFDWARESNEIFKTKILSKSHNDLINYQHLGAAVQLAIPTPDHYYPLMYVLALQLANEEVEIFNDKYVAGSLTMTSLKIG